MIPKDLFREKYSNNQAKYILKCISIGMLIAIPIFIFQKYVILLFLIIYSHFDHKPDTLLSELKSDNPYITVRNIVNWEYSNFRNRNSWSIAYEMSKYNISGYYQYFRKIKGYSLTQSIIEILKLRLFKIVRYDIYYPYNIPLILRLNYSACGNYADIFVYFANKSNITAYKLCATEDHCWNEYIINGENVIADPSSNVTNISSRTYFINPNWTHINRIDLNRYNPVWNLNVPKSDYTVEYLKEDAVNLTINVKFKNKPIKNAKIWIYSIVLSNDLRYRHLYRAPILITYNETSENGIFKVTLRSNETYPLKITYKKFIYCYKFETNLTVEKSTNIIVDLDNANKKPSILRCT